MADRPTILICDDEPNLRELMRMSLEPSYEFAEAADGAEAIDLAERVRPDLVLLDVMMPGTSGLDSDRASAQPAATLLPHRLSSSRPSRRRVTGAPPTPPARPSS